MTSKIIIYWPLIGDCIAIIVTSIVKWKLAIESYISLHFDIGNFRIKNLVAFDKLFESVVLDIEGSLV